MVSCSAKNPRIEITPDEWHLGNIIAGSKTDHTFWIKNFGEGPLKAKFRSNCDCIEIISHPDSIIQPGDSSQLIAQYIAGTEEKLDTKSIFYSSNEKDHEVGKIPVTANIIPFKIDSETKNITMIPFTINIPDHKDANTVIYRSFAMNTKRQLELDFVPSNELAKLVSQDPDYKTKSLPDVVRKWAGSLGIRYTVLGEITKQQGKDVLIIILIDSIFEFPITKLIPEPNFDMIAGVVNSAVSDLFKNIAAERKNATIQNLQSKWMKARQEMINKPAPMLKLKEVRSDKVHNISDYKGEVLFIHFFSIDCEHCEEEIEWVSKIKNQFPDVKPFGIAVDIGEKDSVLAYVEDKKLPYPILLPEKNESFQIEQYYGGATPQSVIIDKNGIVREVMVGFNKSIINNFDKLIKNIVEEDKE